MNRVRLIDVSSSLYNAFQDVYTVSFPIFEQRTEVQQQDAFQNSCYHLDCYMESDCFVGFIAYWEFENYIYVEHFAIHPAERGRGLGGIILKELIASGDKRVLLEIDPVVDEVSSARLRFYKSLGFEENPFSHIHPAYREGFLSHNLIVLATCGQMTDTDYQQFLEDLVTIVMKKAL